MKTTSKSRARNANASMKNFVARQKSYTDEQSYSIGASAMMGAFVGGVVLGAPGAAAGLAIGYGYGAKRPKNQPKQINPR